MKRPTGIRSVCLLALVALAAAACSDSPSPTAPASDRAAAVFKTSAAKPRPRTLYISDLQLSSIYVSLSGGYTPYTVTVTNPSRKDVKSIYLKGELKSENNQPPVQASAFLAYCPMPNGIVPYGECTMSHGITGGATLAPGAGTFTLRVLQQQSDGTMLALDSTTVDVVLTQH
ncbi:MAG TPA: hypothetical protein VK922_16935 [Gemmatimonadaceae bacterium]|nr:hypothetical protein [Gemmatimonadaceae bacterium]